MSLSLITAEERLEAMIEREEMLIDLISEMTPALPMGAAGDVDVVKQKLRNILNHRSAAVGVRRIL